MNELSRHIEILLLDNDCVIVPGLGGFMAHYTSAEFIDDEGLFYPPCRTIGFNPQLQLNDSLLAQSYIEAYDLSYPEAIRRISVEVEAIKQQLSISGEYDFHGIGVLELNAGGCYDFYPCTAGLLTPSLYALNSYAINEIEQRHSAIKSVMIPLNSIGSVEHNVIKAVAMAAAILLLCILNSIPVGIGSGKIQQCSVLNPDIISKIVNVNKEDIVLSLNTDSTSTVDNNINGRDVLQNEMQKPQKKVCAVPHYYVLVVAAKVSKSGAKNLVSKLKKCGFVDTNISERPSNRKVIYGHYDSEVDALNALQTLRNQDITFTDAWISRI